MKLKEILQSLEHWAPLAYQESYDNAGLITGQKEMEITSALICLDSTEAVIDEAIEKGCNLVIAHHPIVFSGLKKWNGSDYIQRVIIKAIKNDIAIYAIHTNLDNVLTGVNAKIAEVLGLKNTRILQKKTGSLKKMVFYCPTKYTDQVKQVLAERGAGRIGDYDSCSFSNSGTGSFRAGDQSNPFVGKPGELHQEEEDRVEFIYHEAIETDLIHALKQEHPYEEVAYHLIQLDNSWDELGSGMYGELPESMKTKDFLDFVRVKLGAEGIRYTDFPKAEVKTIALCGGSGSFLLPAAIAQRADVFLSADFKYHQFFDADGKISILDVGHFESEQFTVNLIQDYLQEKIPNFATYLTSIRTNPINYI